ncbi:MAG: hypothetical protein D6756_06695, partial [Cyanobacteria bacterium J083]
MKLDSTKASQTTKTPQKPPSYKEKTNRIVAWTELIKSFTPYIWLIVICLVLIPLIGRGIISANQRNKYQANNNKPNVRSKRFN